MDAGIYEARFSEQDALVMVLLPQYYTPSAAVQFTIKMPYANQSVGMSRALDYIEELM